MLKQIEKFGIFFLGIIIFILDRLIKNAFYNNQLINPGNWINYTQNYGIAFGLNLPRLFLIILIIILLLLLISWLIKKWRANKYIEAGLIFLIIVGAVSNLLDRFRFGFVIDYIDLKIWPVFNLADSLIVGGVIILILLKINQTQTKIAKRLY